MKLKKEIGMYILFLLSTLFFLFQYNTVYSWDLNAYILNAQYFFSNGHYFEWLRPPLAPIFLGVFSLFTWKAAPYAFIVFVSYAYMRSSTAFARRLEFNEFVFYGLSLNAFVLLNGLINGTELLAVAFLQFGLIALLDDKKSTGIFLGLSALTRYAGLIFFPLLLLQKNVKKILIALLVFGLTITPWLVYNLIKTGNLFTSIADQYANNILYRSYVTYANYPFLTDILIFGNVLLPFFFMGISISIYSLIKEYKEKKPRSSAEIWSYIVSQKIIISMFFLTAITYSSYLGTPLRSARYLFYGVIPLIYFSYIGLQYISEKISKLSKIKTKSLLLGIGIAILMISTLLAITIHAHSDKENEQIYTEIAEKIEELELKKCQIQSNVWVALARQGVFAEPAPREGQINLSLEDNYTLVLLKHGAEPEYVSNELVLNQLPIVHETNVYIIATTGCKDPIAFSATYLEQTNQYITEVHNYSINTNPCFILFEKFSYLEKACNVIHGNGFTKDEMRIKG